MHKVISWRLLKRCCNTDFHIIITKLYTCYVIIKGRIPLKKTLFKRDTCATTDNCLQMRAKEISFVVSGVYFMNLKMVERKSVHRAHNQWGEYLLLLWTYETHKHIFFKFIKLQ